MRHVDISQPVKNFRGIVFQVLVMAGYFSAWASATDNFVVIGADPATNQAVELAAEYHRQALAIEWLGRELPRWSEKAKVRVTVDTSLGGGSTSFYWQAGLVRGIEGYWRGNRQSLIDDVVPHEVLHMVFADHFGGPVPRWADEGACSSVESPQSQQRMTDLLRSHLLSGRGIPFSRMYGMKRYPRDIMPLYSQGHSVASYLISLKGKRHYVNYLSMGIKTGDWTAANRAYYGMDLNQTQVNWNHWVNRSYDIRFVQTSPLRRVFQWASGVWRRCQPSPEGGFT